MADRTVEELYEVIPTELHKQMKMYKPFASLFCKTVNAEHSNLVKAIKENAALLFVPLGLTVNIFSSQSASKATHNKLLLLLKWPENLSLDGKYECLALILFTNPKNMSPNTLFKSRILLNMACLLIVELMGANCVTEGMIAGLAVMGSLMIFKLSPEGNNTKISYHDDFDFHLKLLFKSNNWSREVMDYYNEGVFRHKALSQVSQLEPAPAVPQSHSWEDNFLDKMDQDPDVPPSITPPAQAEFQPPPQADSPPVTVATVHPLPGVSQTTSPSASDLGANVNHQASGSISPRSSGDVDLSATTQVHLGIEKLSLAGPGAAPGQSVSSACCTSTASKWRITPVALMHLLPSCLRNMSHKPVQRSNGILTGVGIPSLFVGLIAYSATTTALSTAAFGGLVYTLVAIHCSQ
ncbi:hypothetical protein J3A83DRAFT_4372641 [Scleroderma citrinum]